MVKPVQVRIGDALESECDYNVLLSDIVATAVHVVGSLRCVHADVGGACPIEMNRQDFSIVEIGPEAKPREKLSGTRYIGKLRLIRHGRILA